MYQFPSSSILHFYAEEAEKERILAEQFQFPSAGILHFYKVTLTDDYKPIAPCQFPSTGILHFYVKRKVYEQLWYVSIPFYGHPSFLR